MQNLQGWARNLRYHHENALARTRTMWFRWALFVIVEPAFLRSGREWAARHSLLREYFSRHILSLDKQQKENMITQEIQKKIVQVDRIRAFCGLLRFCWGCIIWELNTKITTSRFDVLERLEVEPWLTDEASRIELTQCPNSHPTKSDNHSVTPSGLQTQTSLDVYPRFALNDRRPLNNKVFGSTRTPRSSINTANDLLLTRSFYNPPLRDLKYIHILHRLFPNLNSRNHLIPETYIRCLHRASNCGFHYR